MAAWMFNPGCPCCEIYEIVVYMCNSNAVTDDDFDVYINDHLIGVHRSETNECRGEFWRTNPDITPIQAQAGECCDRSADASPPNRGMIRYEITKAGLHLVAGPNILKLQNTRNNFSGNFGLLKVFVMRKTSTGYVVDSKPLDDVYGPSYPTSANYPFTLQAKWLA